MASLCSDDQKVNEMGLDKSAALDPHKKRSVKWNSEQKRERRQKLTMRRWFGYTLLGIAILNTLCVGALVFFCAFGLASLSTAILLTLIGETIAYDTAMFCMVARKLFTD